MSETPMSPDRLAEIRAELEHVTQLAAEATGWHVEDYQAVRGALHSARLLATEVERMRAERAELIRQRDSIADATARTLAGGESTQPDRDEDEWVHCSRSHCPNAERYAKASERGWQHFHMDTWRCPQHPAGAPEAGR